MLTKKAKCISRKVLAAGIVSSTFVFDNHISDFKRVQKNKFNDFTLETVNDKLDVSWSIKARWLEDDLEWRKIKLVKFNKNIYGNFVIESHYGDSEFTAGSFDAKSLPFEQSFQVYDDWSINITMFIYYRESGTVISSVFDDYDKLLNNRDASDVTFVVGTEEIPAHRQVIAARNDALTEMFNSKMFEKTDGRIGITGIEPKIFKLLLRFIYCGKIDVNLNSEDLPKVLAAAKKYCVNDLAKICEQRITHN